MKNLLFTAICGLCLVATTNTSATVRTVNNMALSPGQYTILQDAINASAVDDTVYVQGSITNYGVVSINKRMVLVGAGYYVSGIQSNLTSMITSVTFDTVDNVPISGCRVMGFDINGQFGGPPYATNHPNQGYRHNVILERNRFNNYLYVQGHNWIIRNNIITYPFMFISGDGAGFPTNCIVTNNLIAHSVVGNGTGVNANTNIIFTHNFFYTEYGINEFTNSVVFENNMFYRVSGNAYFSNLINCTFTNNISFGPQAFTLPPANNSGMNNLNNTDPLLADVPTTLGYNYPYHLYDFALQTGSPAINAGTDNTNIGTTGGNNPMSLFNGVPAIPQMKELNILNATLGQGGQLNVNFKARRRD